MLPGLMSLTRIECLRWDGNGGSNWWFVFWWAAPRSVRASGAPHHVLLPESGFSDQCADDLVEGLGLPGLVVQPGAPADQGTADDGGRAARAACGARKHDRGGDP